MGATTEQLWEALHDPLHQFIRRRVRNDTQAEDVLQEVFLKIHQHVDSLRDARQLEGWIYAITRNVIIDYFRSQRPTLTLDWASDLALPENLPDDDVVSELLPCVRAMVQNLPAPDRQALVLTEYQGLTQKELAERLGISLSGAKSRVQRARERLKQQLLDLGSGGGIDVLLSARRVGPTGFAYGLDMTDPMLELAERNRQEAGVENVRFFARILRQDSSPGYGILGRLCGWSARRRNVSRVTPRNRICGCRRRSDTTLPCG